MGYEYRGTGEDRGPEAVRQVKLVPSSVKDPGTGVGRRKSPPGGGKPAPLGATRPEPRPVPAPLPEVLVAGGFRWGDPPAPAVRGRDPLYLTAAIAALKKRPGRWAQVIGGRKTRPDGKAYRRHGLETRTRREEGAETFGLWARWNGE